MDRDETRGGGGEPMLPLNFETHMDILAWAFKDLKVKDLNIYLLKRLFIKFLCIQLSSEFYSVINER